MPPSRRGFLAGLFVAPAIIKLPGLLMPIKRQPLLVYDAAGNTFDAYAAHFMQINEILNDAPYTACKSHSFPHATWRQLNAR